MNVFICHASEQKPLIREIRSFLKKDVFWIDDEKLCIGSEIKKKLKETINYKTDIVLLFVCDKSIKSHWVKEEVDWAIEKEKEIGYNFLIPVILDEKAWNEIEIEELKNRIYLKLNGFTTSDIKSFADELNDLTSTMRHPKIVSKNSRQTTLLLTCVFSSIT